MSDKATSCSEERALVRKLDLRILPLACFIYTLCFLDRVSIGHARLYKIEADLGLSQYQYSWTMSIFFIGYILFEIPSNLMMKKASPPRWISRIMVSWGVVTVCMACVSDFDGMLAARFFLGVAEAGLFPGLIFYLSFWYTRKEQGFRIALLMASTNMAGVIGGPIAYSVAGLQGVWGMKGWQWLFIVEGVPTVLMGIATWWILPATPNHAPWLSASEHMLLEHRLQKDYVDLDISRFEMREFVGVFTDYKTYMFVILFAGINCPAYSMAMLMPTIVNGFGFSVFNTMLLTSPPNIFSLAMVLLVAWNSDRVLERGFHIMACTMVGICGFVVLAFTSNIAVKYTTVIILNGGVNSLLPLIISWTSNSVRGSTRAATTAALIVASGNAAGFAAPYLYTKVEAPLYKMSHLTNATCLLITLFLAVIIKLCLLCQNKKPKLSSNDFRYVV
ncbi:hypothetical protein DSO57_1032570 [Entomophthora muscae]|uniref:Uncharacterized protein n=1 Tax=Entomophthora muscae TaxID=34485 RepID=A0ACC2TMP8_9FUNG|nr:hypothetical protein DSO57_1032570 [Entomophthora muscae]